MRTTGLICVLVLTCLVVGVGIRMAGSRSGYQEVCLNTGMIRHSFTRGPFTTERVQETPLSKVLTGSGYRSPEPHDWLYVHGSGRKLIGGVFKAAGPGLGMRTVVESPLLASNVSLLIAYTDETTVELWLERILDPELTRHCYFSIEPDGVDEQQFLTWLREREELFVDDMHYESLD